MKLLLGFLIALLSSTAFAQSVYIGGYIINPRGDTLKGYIKYPDYNRWVRCPEYIKFKTDTNSHKVLRFNPHTIREFHIDGHETYIAYAGLVSADGNIYPTTGFALDSSKKQDTIFLKQVVTGKHLTLYYHNDRFKTRYFISENNGTPRELQYHLYFENPNKMVSRPMYTAWLISLVNKYAPGDGKLIQQAAETSFSQPDFEDLVNAINNPAGSQPSGG
jgi:hypothetical protein